MSIKKFIVSLIIPVFFFSGCDDLNYNEITVYDLDWIISNPNSGSERMVNDVYSRIPHDFGFYEGGMWQEYNLWDDLKGAMLSSACDESDFSPTLSTIHNYYNGAWNSANPFPFTWINSYKAIASANDFLEKWDQVWAALENFIYNTASDDNNYEQLRARYELFPYQVRFLRAYFHFELAKTYGAVPLVTKTLTPSEANSVARTPVQEVFQFIVDECDAIVDQLPITYKEEPKEQIGRINRPTVLGLKARTLLYAASPLHNPGNDGELWRRAAIANKEAIDKCIEWNIEFSEYRKLWGHDNQVEPEIFFLRRTGEHRRFEEFNFPVGIENGRGGNCPTQNLVDAYEYQSGPNRGLTWPEAEAAGTLEDDPYANLDPRFALTIAKNGDIWPTGVNTLSLETFEGGRNGQPLLNATPTGYYLKKYTSGETNISSNSPNTRRHSWIIFRLAEFYLNYAEAMYYCLGDADATSDGILNMSANQAINELRRRDDINMPLFSGSANFEERYIRERMVELAFEGHRFWDVRRWKKGAQFFKEIKTVNVNSFGIVTRGTGKTRVWDEKYNLYPIPFGELRKNPNLTPNPGWE